MTYRSFNRMVYRTILHLHPAPFRERFAGEMLWIFDETFSEFGMWRLATDALSSLLKQWVAADTVPKTASTPFQFEPASPVSAATLVQATLIVSTALLGFSKLLQQNVPLPQPPKTFEVRRSVPDICEYKLRTSRHAR
jgi:hypothetical protein